MYVSGCCILKKTIRMDIGYSLSNYQTFQLPQIQDMCIKYYVCVAVLFTFRYAMYTIVFILNRGHPL